uniref:Uncharacterized protein n=2 Tax=Cacopsylla melanoneura TaxID=428564 RepID=A0A8D8ZGP1_9HEMI
MNELRLMVQDRGGGQLPSVVIPKGSVVLLVCVQPEGDYAGIFVAKLNLGSQEHVVVPLQSKLKAPVCVHTLNDKHIPVKVNATVLLNQAEPCDVTRMPRAIAMLQTEVEHSFRLFQISNSHSIEQREPSDGIPIFTLETELGVGMNPEFSRLVIHQNGCYADHLNEIELRLIELDHVNQIGDQIALTGISRVVVEAPKVHRTVWKVGEVGLITHVRALTNDLFEIRVHLFEILFQVDSHLMIDEH